MEESSSDYKICIKLALDNAKERILGGEDVSDVSVNGVPLQETIDTTNAISDVDGNGNNNINIDKIRD